MTNISSLQQCIDSTKKRIFQIEVKLMRIRAVEAQNWEDPNPCRFTEHDLWCSEDGSICGCIIGTRGTVHIDESSCNN